MPWTERCEAPLPGPLQNWAPLERQELRSERWLRRMGAKKQPPAPEQPRQVWLCWRVLSPANLLLRAPEAKDLVPEPLRRLGL